MMNLFLRLLYVGYRAYTGITYWTRRRFTVVGQAVLGATVVALFASTDADNAVGYQAFTPLVVAMGSALLFGSRLGFRPRFAVERRLPRLATVGQPLTYRVRLKNLAAHREAGLTLIEDLADPRPDFPEWRDYKLDEDKHVRPFRFDRQRFRSPFQHATLRECEVPAINPQEERELEVVLHPLRRGLIRFEGCTLGRADPLGIFRALQRQSLPQSLLVLPRRYALPPVALPGTRQYQQGGVALASHIGQSDEFVALRDYQRGDPLRHIHWRSWAKVDRPIVKEFEDEFFVRHALILDTFTPRPHSDVFEEAVSVAASFACTALTQESLLDLLFVGAEAYSFTAGRGLAHADQMLEILAAVQPCRTQTFTQLEQLVLGHVSVVSGGICVLLAWDETRQKFVGKLRALGLPVWVFVIRPAQEVAPLDPGPMRDAPECLRALTVGQVQAQLAGLA
ncbi:MAG TPA: DUF58 domain-containing protein [Verrucomicrobiota bacterium]|nr:DUF58 domain-containing protein [Verrucomicrobiota bacterium]HNT14379.1 DUF58 domain-containing protein [Verrucomicrobiota bacterium]